MARTARVMAPDILSRIVQGGIGGTGGEICMASAAFAENQIVVVRQDSRYVRWTSR